jgi:hypothetical protein
MEKVFGDIMRHCGEAKSPRIERDFERKRKIKSGGAGEY